jgi:hypothetical protein
MHRPLRQRTAAYHVVEYAALCITTKNDADVRYGSFATGGRTGRKSSHVRYVPTVSGPHVAMGH